MRRWISISLMVAILTPRAYALEEGIARWVEFFADGTMAPLKLADLMNTKPDAFWVGSKDDSFLPLRYLYRISGTSDGFVVGVYRRTHLDEMVTARPVEFQDASDLSEIFRMNRVFLKQIKKRARYEDRLENYGKKVETFSADSSYAELVFATAGLMAFGFASVKAPRPWQRVASALGFSVLTLVTCNLAMDQAAAARQSEVLTRLEAVKARLSVLEQEHPDQMLEHLEKVASEMTKPQVTVVGATALASMFLGSAISIFVIEQVLPTLKSITPGRKVASEILVISAVTGVLVSKTLLSQTLDHPAGLSPGFVNQEIDLELAKFEDRLGLR